MSRTFLDNLLIEKKSRRQFIFLFTPASSNLGNFCSNLSNFKKSEN